MSRHVFISRHYGGAVAFVFHGVLAANKLVFQGIAGLVNLVTLGTVRPLRVRGRVWLSLVGYYARRLCGGDWISPRAARTSAGPESNEATSEV